MRFKAILPILLCSQINMATTPNKVIHEANQKASYQPNSKQFVNAGMIFDWEPNKIYQIYTQPGRITDITLEPGEELYSIAGGDTQRWTISQSKSKKANKIVKHIFVKPHQTGISNNIVLTTNKRVYHIELHSLSTVSYQAIVSWNYPKPLVLVSKKIPTTNKNQIRSKPTPLSNINKAKLNFSYHFVTNEKPNWMPKRVFDDGQKTYIEFYDDIKNMDAPALWALSSKREKTIVNYRRYKNFYIIDHLVEILELSVDAENGPKVGIEKENM